MKKTANAEPATDVDRFIEAACATHCALYDTDHDAELDRARAMLLEDPGLAEANLITASITGDVETVRRLLDADGAAATVKAGSRAWEPLLYLAFSRFLRDRTDRERIERIVDVARLLLDRGGNPNAFFTLGDERETALYAACGAANNADLARVLLEAGADVNDAEAAYHVAEFDSHECIRVLFEAGLDPAHRATVLLRKLDFDDLDGVRRILEWGADPNGRGAWKKTPLHQAIMRGRGVAFVELLIEHGATVHARRGDGRTAYAIAARLGRHDVVDVLARHGAKGDMEPIDQLIAACARADEESARAVLEAHPDVLRKPEPEDAAAITDLAREGLTDAVRIMLESGFDVAARDGQGFTPLHWAAWYGHLDLVRLLIARGAPLEAKNAYGGTVLDATVWGCANSDGDEALCVAVIDLLVEAGADVGAVSPFPSGRDAVDAALRRYGRS